MKKLEDFEKTELGIFPTPIRKLENISRMFGTNIWIKRDDLTGIGVGGNKVRKLEYLLADAKKQGAELIFTTGQAQSNHAMLTAACRRRFDIEPVLILKKRGIMGNRGNLMLESLMNTEVIFMDCESYDEIYEEMDRIGVSRGKKYYKIPCGGSNGLGSLGYADCVREIAGQEKELGVNFRFIICPEGSGGTAAGLTLGQKLYMPEAEVIGAKVDTDPFEKITPEIIRESLRLLESDMEIRDEDVHHVDAAGPGYAILSEEGLEAIRIMAENEGLFLDPVYTGKAFGALLRMAKEGRFGKDDNVLFIHTGGIGGLFAFDIA